MQKAEAAQPLRPSFSSQPAMHMPGGRGGLTPTGTVHGMDAVDEPPGVRAHCLRGTASHALERTAASGWAGPRSGVHGVSRWGLTRLDHTAAMTS